MYLNIKHLIMYLNMKHLIIMYLNIKHLIMYLNMKHLNLCEAGPLCHSKYQNSTVVPLC